MEQHGNDANPNEYDDPNNRGSKMPRELKVEDALLYLDQVKLEFSDKPHIYNEFLEIMKNFKAQSINTPGVIDRVRTLFKGYNKLILGFNTFLPDGYKIELTAEEIASEQAVSQVDSMRQASSSSGGSNITSITSIPAAATVASNQASAQYNVTSASSNAAGSSNDPNQRQPQQMQQQHAITYVTTIRNRFANEPETYRAFLRILHTYQKEQKGIKDVLEQVSHLFADHPDLLMEFTYFLPDAVQDQAKERLHRAAKESEMRRRMMQQSQQQMFGGLPNAATMAALSSSNNNQAMKKSRTDRGQTMSMMSGQLSGVNQHQAIYDAHLLQQQTANARKLSSGAAAIVQQQHQQQRGNKGPNKRKLADVVGGGMGGVGMNNAGLSVSQYNAFIQAQQQAQAQGGSNRMSYVDAERLNATLAAAQAAGLLPHHQDRGKLSSSRHENRSSSDMMTTNHISVTTERRLFDNIKDLLSSNTREGWTDFIKCLDLFIVDAISKKDMLTLVQEFFELSSGGDDLYDEFKRLLNSRADHDSHQHTNGQDIWYAMPLSEIDFSQCRKCTPSYRALPLNYPKPQCSERDAMEVTVLNDQWVSIPIGSEESYSFKHMRKNQYEEALFKCEDDRFEIDMIIDTNVSAIRILEPIAEEIINLSKLDTEHHTTSSSSSSSNNIKFNFSLEKRNLSTVHLNAITRIYGEHGSEILELLRKNPAGTIPVVLRRLKQKDLEWRKARQELNKSWKETMEKNYDKSFDHRSFYFKQHDKRTYSIKHLVADIKNITPNIHHYNNSDNNNLLSYDMMIPAEVSVNVSSELSSLLLPDTSCMMLPQLNLTFACQDMIIHSDIYMVFSHMAESNPSIPVYDRERMTACWRDWLRPLFQIPSYMLYPSSSPSSSSSGMMIDTIPVDVSEAYPVGMMVLTIYGSGKIMSFRAHDSMYEVLLSFGRGYFKSSSIIGAEELSSQALAAVGIVRDAHGIDRLNGSTFTELSSSSSSSSSSVMLYEPSTIFYGTQSSYTFLRVYHSIYTRLALAKQLAYEAAASSYESSSSSSMASSSPSSSIDDDLQMKSPSMIILAGAQSKYSTYLSQLMCLLDGTLELSRYEDAVRQLLGNKAYVLYTMDKVLLQGLKMFQALTNDENFNRLIGIFVYQRSISSSSTTSSTSSSSLSSSSSTATKKNNKSKSSSSSSASSSLSSDAAMMYGGTSRRAVNVMHYLNHVKQMTAYGYEDLYRFQLLNKGDYVTNPQLAIQCMSATSAPVNISSITSSSSSSSGLQTRNSASNNLETKSNTGSLIDDRDGLVANILTSASSSIAPSDNDGNDEDDEDMIDDNDDDNGNDDDEEDNDSLQRGDMEMVDE